MKKLFGEYLVEKEVLSSKDLVGCLMEQVERLPSLHKIIFENKFLDEDKILKAIAFQHQAITDFRSALKHYGFWTIELESKVNSILNQHKIPLGKILVEQGYLEQDELVDHLDKFLSEFAETNINHKLEEVDIKDSPAVAAAVNKEESEEFKPSLAEDIIVSDKMESTQEEVELIGEAVDNVIALDQKVEKELDFSIEFSIIEDGLIQDYIELLTEDRKTEVDNMILSWEKLDTDNLDIDTLAKDFRDLYRELHTYKGSACFIKAELTEKIIHAAEEVLNKYQTFIDKLDSVDIDLMISYMLQVLDIVWELKYIIQQTSSEEFIWKTEIFRNKYTHLYFNLQDRLSVFEEMNVDLDDVSDAF